MSVRTLLAVAAVCGALGGACGDDDARTETGAATGTLRAMELDCPGGGTEGMSSYLDPAEPGAADPLSAVHALATELGRTDWDAEGFFVVPGTPEGSALVGYQEGDRISASFGLVEGDGGWHVEQMESCPRLGAP